LQALPSLNSHGVLDPGFYDLSLTEVSELFGQFQRTDRRLELFKRLTALVEEVKAFTFSHQLIIDGSFITSKDEPSDVDLIFVVKEGTFPLATVINPFEYNALSSKRLKKKYAFDVIVVNERSQAYDSYVEYFTRLKEGPSDVRKGLVRLELR
jgi:hypothetical protein